MAAFKNSPLVPDDIELLSSCLVRVGIRTGSTVAREIRERLAERGDLLSVNGSREPTVSAAAFRNVLQDFVRPAERVQQVVG